MKKHNGSSLLIIVLIISTVLLLIGKKAFTASLLLEQSMQHAVAEQRFRLTEGLFNYAIQLTKENFDYIIIQKRAIAGTISQWPPFEIEGVGHYPAEIILQATSEQEINIKTIVYDPKRTMICRIQGSLIRENTNKESNFYLTQWQLS